ncbi:hypothetical protein [Trichloromonas sp.]|uniref:hypothetical protein n=1 Tax=Trichloromonas sp. TaxID=3069249 RepID=UPI003D818B69
MGRRNWQLMEISRRIKNDPEAGLLLDRFLNACFDSVPPPDWAPVKADTPEPQENSERLSTTLNQLNLYLKTHALLPEGIQPPCDIELDEWAENITMQILTNGVY